jgi:soluble lytic murein transglycosylase
MLQNAIHLGIALILLPILFTVGCSAQQTEEQALESLRQMTQGGKLPAEQYVANIETKFAGKKTGALAKLLRARIRFDAGDLAGAAAILNTDVFNTKTGVADHALWLRGRALQGIGSHAEAMKSFSQLIESHPDSVRSRDARLLWATSAIAAGRAADVPAFLTELTEKRDADALLLTAKAYDAKGSAAEAEKYYRQTYFYAAGSAAANEAKLKLTAADPALGPKTADEQLALADGLLNAKRYSDAAAAYRDLTQIFPTDVTSAIRLRHIAALTGSGKPADAQAVFNLLPAPAPEREEGYRHLVLGYAKAKVWPQARATADEMRQKFPQSPLVPTTLMDAGLAARDTRNRSDESYFFSTALNSYPQAIEVALAQFELAWLQHESRNFTLSSQMLTDHLERYVDRDNTNRGKAGYWAARDSERAGKVAEACALYDGVAYRYGANWYGYLAEGRLATMRNQGHCKTTTPPNPKVAKAVENLKLVTVAAETAGEKELARAQKSEELSTIGLFDWSLDELTEAKKTAANSPKINLALAKHYRLKGDNVNALLTLAKSYPDYAQMFPEELGREEWDIFYPLTNWSDIKTWAQNRGLDRYQVAGVIRQETIFDADARSHANAYGLMQLLMPTAQSMARKYGSTMPSTPTDLYRPSLNIELGTAYMKDQFAKFGRIEYVAIAYNAGPGRVPQWRATLPPEMDEFVEEIPFKETRGYVQGIIRNSAQYRRLYDDSGNFKPNVGTRPLRGEIDSRPRDQFTAEFPEVVVDDVPSNS